MNWISKVFATPADVDRSWDTKALELTVASIAAALPEPWGRDHLVDRAIVRRSATGKIAGRAVTVWNPPGTNTMIRFGIEACGPGDVLVVSTPSDVAAQWGDLAHSWATARGLAGVVIDGAVRDVDAVRNLDLPIWSRAIDPRQALKSAHGYVNAPVNVGGVRVCPGDLIIADGDGIVVVPGEDVREAIEQGLAREEQERVSRSDLQRGRISTHLAEIFAPDGIAYVGREWNASQNT